MNRHQPITKPPASGAVLFDTVDDFFNALFPHPDCNAHVVAYRRHQHLAAYHKWADAADARVRALLESKRAAR